MKQLVAEDGRGVVFADGSTELAVDYHIETWLKPGGFKISRGWISAEHHILQSLVPAAEAILETEDGSRWPIELTEVKGDRADVRFPNRVG